MLSGPFHKREKKLRVPVVAARDKGHTRSRKVCGRGVKMRSSYRRMGRKPRKVARERGKGTRYCKKCVENQFFMNSCTAVSSFFVFSVLGFVCAVRLGTNRGTLCLCTCSSSLTLKLPCATQEGLDPKTLDDGKIIYGCLMCMCRSVC